MTFYEELGVRPEASIDEIRRAYRNLTKVFHPDLHPAGDQRAQAEEKMLRLNEILSVLGDPLRRLQYDQSVLRAATPSPARRIGRMPPPPAGVLRTFGVPVLIMLSGFLAAGASLWYYAGGFTFVESAPAPVVAQATPPLAELPAKPEERGRRARRRAEPAREDSAIVEYGSQQVPREPAAPREPVAAPRLATPAPVDLGTPPALPPAELAVSQLPPPLPSSSEPSPAAPREEPPAVLADPYEGTWLYAPSRVSFDDGAKMYAPKYIELKIQKEGGLLFGRYRGSYNVHDQPISPNVNFNFKGKPTGSATKLAWTATGGANGAVELKVLSERTLQVDWKVNETGGNIELVTGTAVLVRRAE